MIKRIDFDYDEYHKRIRKNPCLFCSLASGAQKNPSEYFVYEDDFAAVILDRYPTQLGYCLVFPKVHYELVQLLDEQVFLHLQSIVLLTVKAISFAIDVERIYTACLGSQLLTPHIHYHIAPIPHGLPLEKQQWNSMDKSRGVIEYSPKVFNELANKIRIGFDRVKANYVSPSVPLDLS